MTEGAEAGWYNTSVQSSWAGSPNTNPQLIILTVSVTHHKSYTHTFYLKISTRQFWLKKCLICVRTDQKSAFTESILIKIWDIKHGSIKQILSMNYPVWQQKGPCANLNFWDSVYPLISKTTKNYHCPIFGKCALKFSTAHTVHTRRGT